MNIVLRGVRIFYKDKFSALFLEEYCVNLHFYLFWENRFFSFILAFYTCINLNNFFCCCLFLRINLEKFVPFFPRDIFFHQNTGSSIKIRTHYIEYHQSPDDVMPNFISKSHCWTFRLTKEVSFIGNFHLEGCQ